MRIRITHLSQHPISHNIIHTNHTPRLNHLPRKLEIPPIIHLIRINKHKPKPWPAPRLNFLPQPRKNIHPSPMDNLNPIF